jgi:pimeloyl-ACP methyl ester carboxylesterase
VIRSLMIGASAALVLAAAVTLQAKQRPSAAAPAADSTSIGAAVRFERVRLSTGVELHVAQSGPPDGKPVLFLHGFPDSWFSYSSILGGLPANVRAIVPSQRGHGDSERPECCYRIADLASDAVALLDALRIERADVVGHSMGSFVAQRIASTYPERVGRLVLIGSSTTAASKPVVEFNAIAQTLTEPISISFAREFQVSTAYQPVESAYMDRLVGESMKIPARVWRGIAGGLVSAEGKSDLSRIKAKTLIVWGEHDSLFGAAEQEALRRALPNARFISYPDLGHSPFWEDPRRVVTDLASFLR